jgi:tetratricopeptide (TPR) repeat protein
VKTRRVVLASAVAVVVGLGAWFGWRWATTPQLPELPTEGDPATLQAIEEASREVRRRPRSGEAWGKLGMTLANSGANPPALACFAHAERFDPKNPTWPYLRASLNARLGNFNQTFALLRKALSLARSAQERSALLFMLATMLAQEAEPEEAASYVEQLRAVDPDDPRVRFAEGLLAANQGETARARERLSKLADHPWFRKRVNTLLSTLTDGDQALALKYQQRADSLPPDDPLPDPFQEELARHRVERPKPYAEFARLQQQGHHEEALALLQQQVRDAPDAENCFLLGLTLCGGRFHRFEEAAGFLRKSLSFDPKNARAHLFLGVALLGQAEQLERDEGRSRASAKLARDAVAAEDEAIKLQRNLADAHLMRGRALRQLGRAGDALEAFREAVRCQPETAEMHQALGETLAESGQTREGLQCLETAARLARPDDPRPKAALAKWRAKAKAPK